MRTKPLSKNFGFSVVVALAGVFASSGAQAQIVANGSFEAPIPSRYVAFNQTGVTSDSWTYSGYGGTMEQGGFSGTAPATAPEGIQFGFAETFQGVLSSISQDITLPSTGAYTLSYQEAGRLPVGTAASGMALYEVRLTQGGTPTVIGVSTSVPDAVFIPKLFAFNADAGPATLTFDLTQSLSGTTDDTVFFDVVTITPVPEPASLGLLGLGAIGLLARRRGA